MDSKSKFVETPECYRVEWERKTTEMEDFSIVKNIFVQREGYANIHFGSVTKTWRIFEHTEETVGYSIV